MHCTPIIYRVGRAVGGAVLLLALFWILAGGLGRAPVAQAETANQGVTLSGPAAADLGQSVTYTVVFTTFADPTWFLVYRYPPGFEVTQRTAGAVQVNESLVWNATSLGAIRTLTVTGRYRLGGCAATLHRASLGDIYDPGAALPSATLTTLVNRVRCVLLPMIFKPGS